MRSRLVETFCTFVQMPSESGEENDFISFLLYKFQNDLQADCQIDTYGNLIARIPAKGCKIGPPILFGMHADTVKPGKGIKPIIRGDCIWSSGDTILGADCKAGIAELTEAILTADSHPSLEIVISRQEEVGKLGLKNFDFTLLHSSQGFILDSDALDTIVVGGPSYMYLDIQIDSSLDVQPIIDSDYSALKTACLVIAVMPQGRIDPETTINLGVMQSGNARGHAPQNVKIQAECRSLNHEKCLSLSQSITELFQATAKCHNSNATVRVTLSSKAYCISEHARTVQIASRAIRDIGLTPSTLTICGGTEAAIYNEKGIEAAVIGIGVQAEHSNLEHIVIADMENAVRLLHSIFRHLCQEE
jgi:tripeptide aminopeptidase